MEYKEHLIQELKQAESQLQEMEALEQKKMKQRKTLNNQLLKIQMKKQEVKATIQTNKETLHNLQRMEMTFK